MPQLSTSEGRPGTGHLFPNTRERGVIGGSLLLALLLSSPLARAAGPSCSGSSGSYSCSYTCDDADDDVANINSAIQRVSAGGGGVVTLTAGICQVNSPISFQASTATYPNVWLKGAGMGTVGSGAGGTVLRRTLFQLNQPMIAAYKSPASGWSQTNSNIQITDLTLDPGTLFITTLSPIVVRAGSSSINLPTSSFTKKIGSSFSGIGPGIYDFSTVGAVNLPANGNVTSITPTQNGISLGLAEPTIAQISKGDVLAFYSGGGGLEAQYLAGLQVNNVQFLHGSFIDIQNDKNFVISNSTFVADNDFGTFFCLGGIFIGSNGFGASNPEPNNYGMVVNNKVTYSSIEVDSFNTVVSGNTVSSTSCSGINGGIGEYDTFQSNVLTPSLLATTDPHYPSIVVPLNHDNLFNPSMQIWNPNALISGNLVYGGGSDGVFSGGSNSVVTHNVVHDNSLSPYNNNSKGGSGIVLQGVGPSTQNEYVTANWSCNTADGAGGGNPSHPNCLSNQNSGSQQYALEVRDDVGSANIAYDNEFFPGQKGVIGNVYNTPLNYSYTLPEATISATSCSLGPGSGTCSVTVTWSSSNVGNAYVYVINSNDPSTPQLFATGKSGSAQANWIQNAIYAFKVMSDQGLWLASVTVQPNNYSK